MTPIYPEFKKISQDDKKNFEVLKQLDSYSDFNLMSLLSWNSEGTNEYSMISNDCVVLKMKDYLSDKRIYSILGVGASNLNASVETLICDFKELNMVPEIVVNLLSDELKSSFVVREDRDSFDYILSLEKLTKLEGSNIKQLRRYVKNFEKSYSAMSLKLLDLQNSNDISLIMNLTRDWVLQKGFDEAKLNEELDITKNFLQCAQFFNCVALGLFINDKLIAFTLNEIISPSLIMGHFGKSDNSYKHSSYFMEHMNAKYFFEQGYIYLNHQQDTGLLGLRTAKLTYAPVKFLKKFTITKKAN